MTQNNSEKPYLKLTGEDGNAFAILIKAKHAGEDAGWTNGHWEEVFEDATSGDYDHLLAVMTKHFDTH